MVGGYVLIDFENVLVGAQAVKIDGIFEALDNANKNSKMVIVKNLNIANTVTTPFPVLVYVDRSSYAFNVLTLGGEYNVIISNDDTITATAV